MRRTHWTGLLTAGLLVASGLGALGGLGSLGCVGGSKGLSSEDKERLKPYILEAAPADVQAKLDTNFENKIRLVGFKAEPATAKPGTEVKLTYYWRCDDTLDDGWKLFTHLVDETNAAQGNLDGVGPLREARKDRQILGPDRWEKGKVYADEQTWKVPDNYKGSSVVVYVGIWKDDARLRVISGAQDGDNRARVGEVKTGLAPHTTNDAKPAETGRELRVMKLAQGEKVTVDGKADERGWGGAASTGPFGDVRTGKPNTTFPVNATAKLMWDDANLYAFIDVKSTDFYAGFTDAKAQPGDFTASNQPKLWTKDTIELMVDPDGDGDNKDYYEIQINPQNKVFKSQFDTLQQPNGGANGPFGHEDWDPKMKTAVVLNKGADGKTTGYSVEVAIPWEGFSKAQNKPPKPGDTWRMNFYGMKNNSGVSWSPIADERSNFHAAKHFGKVVWLAPTTATATAGDAATPSLGAIKRFASPPLHPNAPGAPPAAAPAAPK